VKRNVNISPHNWMAEGGSYCRRCFEASREQRKTTRFRSTGIGCGPTDVISDLVNCALQFSSIGGIDFDYRLIERISKSTKGLNVNFYLNFSGTCSATREVFLAFFTLAG